MNDFTTKKNKGKKPFLPLFIHGRHGTGKTVIIREIMKRLELMNVYLDCNQVTSEESLFSMIGGQLESEQTKCNKLLDIVEILQQTEFSPNTLYIILDNVDKFRDQEELLNVLINLDNIVRKIPRSLALLFFIFHVENSVTRIFVSY